jgi:hypothetical protein
MSSNSNEKEANPFSFKNYLSSSKQNEVLSNFEKKSDDIFNDDELNDSSEADNPFSFKKFTEQIPESFPNIDDKTPYSNYDLLPNLSEIIPDINNEIRIDGLNSLGSERHNLRADNFESGSDIDVCSLPASHKDSTLNFSLPDDLPSNLDYFETSHAASISNSKLIDGLHEQLEAKEAIISMQQRKIEKLEKKLKDLIEKERTENTALEQVVQRVEKKLELATTRAVESEKLVDILKQENTQLKTQLKLLANENYNVYAEKTKHVYASINDIAKELNKAAQSAEKSISFLSSGVDHLKLIASNLESLEKISEIKE